MLKTILLIIVSFFAVIGFLECLVVMLETVSFCKYDNISKISIVAKLKGNVPDAPFLLNTLLIQADKIRYKNVDTVVVIKDDGLDDATYSQIYEFCLENDNISIEN